LKADVLDTFVRMHERLDETRSRVPAARFFEVRYEDLLRDPIGRLEELYRALELGSFDVARKPIEAYLAGTGDYKTNRYELAPADRAAVTARWGHIVRRYGYPVRE
jgi:hypothetical protein